mgnify:CR=1 FL=1
MELIFFSSSNVDFDANPIIAMRILEILDDDNSFIPFHKRRRQCALN